MAYPIYDPWLKYTNPIEYKKQQEYEQARRKRDIVDKQEAEELRKEQEEKRLEWQYRTNFSRYQKKIDNDDD